jgi:hypothetical protein
MKRLLRKPSPSMFVALVALVVALGGTGYAAIFLPKNSVGTKQLKKNAVTSKKIKNHTIKAADLNQGEDWHIVGDTGEPAFQSGWTNSDNNATQHEPRAGFYKDPLGVVHLEGHVQLGQIRTTVFTLPEGYRPQWNLIELAWRQDIANNSSAPGEVWICGNSGQCPGNPGDVVVYTGPGGGAGTSFDGLTFRAEQ